jgi:predicted GIY-YIG superfamily endonuclease
MNIWNEAYPRDLDSLIFKSKKSAKLILDKLNNKSCRSLSELYQNSGMTKDNRIFEYLDCTPNSTLYKTSKKQNEIKGLYVFGEINEFNGEVIPKYIGISRTIVRRLKQHGWGINHNQASLAASKAMRKKTHHDKFRSTMTKETIRKQQEIIRNYKVVILPELNDYDMYFMEVYLAGLWKTEWNSFRTH